MIYTDEKDIQLFCSDCVDFVNSINEESIDMVITSPPYDNLREYGGHTYDFEALGLQLYRALKSGGVVIWVVADASIDGSETGTSFKQALYFKEIGFNIHDTMIYAKNNPMPTSGDRYHQSFEYMFCFSKGKPKTFNPIKVDSKYDGLANMKNRGVSGELNYVKIERTESHKVGNIFTYSIGGGINTKDKIAYNHPAIFPENLVSDQISTWSNKNDLICDPMMGSGTVAKICMLNNRRFIGADINPEYVNLCKTRIEENRKSCLFEII